MEDTIRCDQMYRGRTSYVFNKISTQVATQLCIRLRRDLLLVARFLHVQQRLTKTPRQQQKNKQKPNDLSYTMLNRVQPTKYKVPPHDQEAMRRLRGLAV